MNDEKEQICNIFHELIGEDGCGVSCSDAEIYKEDGQWKIFLAGFMAPWPLGATVAEVEASLRDYAGMGHGLG